MNSQMYMLDVISYLSYFIYVCLLFGALVTMPSYLETIKTGIQLYISIFLVWRFNKYTNTSIRFTELDRRIVSKAGQFLLFTSVVGAFFEKYLTEILDFIKPKLNLWRKLEKKINNNSV
jgi:hypothetical protein